MIEWEGICPNCGNPCTLTMRFGYVDSVSLCKYHKPKEESACE